MGCIFHVEYVDKHTIKQNNATSERLRIFMVLYKLVLHYITSDLVNYQTQ